MSRTSSLLPLETITQRILLLRGHCERVELKAPGTHRRPPCGEKVLLDADLAALYGVETRRLNEQVRRNLERFPEDFIFEVTAGEFADLKSHFATSSWGGRRKLPLAFTEHGAIMVATVLNSPRAVEVSVYVVRAFVQLCEVLLTNKELAKRLDDLEQKTEALAMRHGTLARNTRVQLKQVFDAIRELMAPPEPQPKRPIGFVIPEEKPAKPKAAKKLPAGKLVGQARER